MLLPSFSLLLRSLLAPYLRYAHASVPLLPPAMLDILDDYMKLRGWQYVAPWWPTVRSGSSRSSRSSSACDTERARQKKEPPRPKKQFAARRACR